jgi:hypothetical protein
VAGRRIATGAATRASELSIFYFAVSVALTGAHFNKKAKKRASHNQADPTTKEQRCGAPCANRKAYRTQQCAVAP